MDMRMEKETCTYLEAVSLESLDPEKESVQDHAPSRIVDPYNELANSELNRKLLRKQDWRLVPITSAMYLLAYLDRSNIGNAKVMNSENKKDLLSVINISNTQYSIALMVFLIAYTIFEVPANYFLKQLGPSKWFALLMICWGAVGSGMGGIQNLAGLTATRFIMGMFEAGLAPGLAFYMSFWYRADERCTRLAYIYSTATLSGAFGGALAYGISHLNMAGHLEGWRWLFILEGVPSILFGIFILFCLPDYPETATWLNEEERELAKARMAHNGSQGSAQNMTWADAKATLCDIRLYAHYIIYFAKSCPLASLSLFTPSIVAGLGYNSINAQLMTVPPYAAAFVATIVLCYVADKYNKRSYVTIGCMLLGAAGFITSACLPPKAYGARYACLVIALIGTFTTIPILLGWLSANLHSTSAQSLAIALNISFGAPGQITGVWIYKDDEKNIGYPTGHWTNGGLLLLGASMTAGLVVLYTIRNRRIDCGLSDSPRWAL